MRFLPEGAEKYRFSQTDKQLFGALMQTLSAKNPQIFFDLFKNEKHYGVLFFAVEKILQQRFEYSWLFTQDQGMADLSFLEKDPRFFLFISQYEYCLQKPLPETIHSVYLCEGRLLWEELERDLCVFSFPRDSHRWLNLKQFVQWGQAQKELNDSRAIAKILFAWLKEVIFCLDIPVFFLIHLHILVIVLDPFLESAYSSFVEILKKTDFFKLRSALFQYGMENEIREKQFLFHAVDALKQNPESLFRTAQFLFSHRVSGFSKGLSHQKLASLLCEGFAKNQDFLPLLEAALFYFLKSFSHTKDKIFLEDLICLSVIFKDRELFNQCQEILGNENYFFVFQNCAQNLCYRFSAEEEWKKVPLYVKIPTTKKTRIHLRGNDFHEVFFLENFGVYGYENQDIILQNKELFSWNSSRIYHFSGKQISFLQTKISSLSPFHFLEYSSDAQERADKDIEVSNLRKNFSDKGTE